MDSKWEINYLVLGGGRAIWWLVSRAGVPIFGGSWGPAWYNGWVSFLSHPHPQPLPFSPSHSSWPAWELSLSST